MQFPSFSIIAATLALSVIGGVSGSCFQSGQNWGDHGVAKAELREACKQLHGFYNKGANRKVCRNSGSISFSFQIHNTGNGVNVAEDYCNTYIGEQIDNCGHGGKITRSNVEYRGDPNGGHC